MKFRTDFVTNSSSSSYCVSVTVKPKGKKEIVLQPSSLKCFEGASLYLKSEIDGFISKAKECKSVQELTDLIHNEMDYIDLFGGDPEDCGISVDKSSPDFNDVLIEKITEISQLNDETENDSPVSVKDANDFIEIIQEFRKRIKRVKDINDIESVTVNEWYNGGGEFAREGIDEFLEKILPEDLEWSENYSDDVRKALSDKLNEDEIDQIIDQIKNDSIFSFDAYINTTVALEDGKIRKKYRFYGMRESDLDFE